MKMDKISALIPMDMRLDLEYIANKHNTNISMLIRAFLKRCIDDAMEKEQEDEQGISEVG